MIHFLEQSLDLELERGGFYVLCPSGPGLGSNYGQQSTGHGGRLRVSEHNRNAQIIAGYLGRIIRGAQLGCNVDGDDRIPFLGEFLVDTLKGGYGCRRGLRQAAASVVSPTLR